MLGLVAYLLVGYEAEKAFPTWYVNGVFVGRQPAPLPAFNPVFLDGAASSSQFTVAYFGDQGLGEHSRAVLSLIKSENVQLAVHLGDLEYHDDPTAWNNQIDAILGTDFPYIAVIGNHDELKWPEYQQKIKERLARTGSTVKCDGNIGTESTCHIGNLDIVMSAPGITDFSPTEQLEYTEHQLALGHDEGAAWETCAWHKDHSSMQVGSKTDEVSIDMYEACRKAGAVIAAAHEHSYSRSYLLSNFKTPTIVSTSSVLNIAPGKSFVFVSGLGGESIRSQVLKNKWWASVYTSTQHATYGAMFCTYNVGGDPTLAACRFKNIKGQIVDSFQIRRSN